MFERTDNSTRQIVIAAIMASLVCVTTLLIQVPIPATQGFFNVGDAMIMLAAFIGGPIVGAIAGGLGASLADFIGGWYVWVVPTLIIKNIEKFLAGWIGRNGFSRKPISSNPARKKLFYIFNNQCRNNPNIPTTNKISQRSS